MASTQLKFVIQTQERMANGQKPERSYKSASAASNRALRARKIGFQPVVIPRETVPLKKAKISMALPEKFGQMFQPNRDQPPFYRVTPYAMSHFGEFIEAVAWCGLEYGAVQLHLPTMEEDGSWWPRTQAGTVRKSWKYVLEGRLQNLRPQGPEGSQAYALDWTPVPKSQSMKRAGVFRWEKYLMDQKGREEQDSCALWALENEGKAKKNKLYGVDASAALFNRMESPLNVFNQPFNLLNVCQQKILGMHTPYVYGCSPGTVFAWHLEDFQLYSAHYHIDGAAKVWYTVPAYYIQNFVEYQRGLTGLQGTENMPISCPQFLRHQGLLNSEQSLPLTYARWKSTGFKCYKWVQRKGTMIITWPGVYYSGINTGYNLNEAVNFGTRSWLDEGRKYERCKCQKLDGSPVSEMSLDMEEIVRKVEGNEN